MPKLIVRCLFIIGSVWAQDPAAGKKTYQAHCVLCHSEDGSGNPDQQAPMLKGQHDWYLLSQLIAFKAKIRSNEKMYPYIKDLSEQDFKNLAAYISTL